MSNLPKSHLTHNNDKGGWDLRQAGSHRLIEHFDTKADATAGGALADALGKSGGSVRIHTTDGKIQEERTFPRSADPRSSKG